MAIRTDCPKDAHGRFRCADCHRALSEQERKDWTGPP